MYKQYIISPKELNIDELPEKQWELNYVKTNKNIKTSDINANQVFMFQMRILLEWK